MRICVECKNHPTGYAKLEETAWQKYPVEVKEYKCSRCKRVRKWWWFV